MSLDILFAELTSSQLTPTDIILMESMPEDMEDSPTYGWNGALMRAIVGGPLPVVYGRHIVAPNVINVYIEEGENETLNILVALCEGEIESISNVKLNGSPLEEFYGEASGDPYGENAEVTTRLGTSNQSIIENFGDIHNVYSDNTILEQSSSYTYTTTGTAVECFRLCFNMTSLYQLDSEWNHVGWYYAVQIEYRVNGTSDWTFAGIHEFNGLMETQFNRYFKSEYLTPEKYDIRVTKVSSDQDGEHYGVLSLSSVDEITTQDLSYPSTALLGLRLVASESLANALPNITAVVTGTKVRTPDVQDGSGDSVSWEDYYWDSTSEVFKKLSNDGTLVWDGSSYVTAWSGNPAWCIRDLLTNTRYGLGQYISSSNIDEDSFLASAKYFDEGVDNLDGNKEKRMMLDIVLDSSMSALDALYKLCSTCRGLLYISSGKIRLTVEKQVDASYTFNMTSIVADSFAINYASKSSTPNILTLQYANVDKDYQMDEYEIGNEESLVDGEIERQKKIQFIGCTRLSQALREGNILMKKLKYQTKQIKFIAGMGAINLQPGDVINFQHDLPQWGEGGRVQAQSTTTLVKLDKTVTLDVGQTYEIEVRSSITDTIEKRTVSESPGSYSELTVSSAFSFVPSVNDEWSFGVQNHAYEQFRVRSIQRRHKDGEISIDAILYDENVYDYSGVTIPEDEFKYLTLEIPDVTNLIVKEETTRLPDGKIDIAINISYTKPSVSSRWVKKATSFLIYLSDDDGKSWGSNIGETDKDFFTIKKPFAVGRRYVVAVVSKTEEGESKVPSNSPQYAITIEGWKQAPNNVSNFSYTFTDEILLTWDKNTDSDLAGYEIRLNNDNWGSDDSNLVWRGKADSYTIVRPTARDGITYLIKAYNTSGTYSPEAAYLQPVNAMPSAPSLLVTNLFQKAFLMWNDLSDADLVEYEIWENDSDTWTGTETGNEALLSKAQGTSITVIINYSTTYYRIRGVDKFGEGHWSNSVSADQINIEGGQIGPDSISETHIQDDSITTPKLVASSVIAAKIAANSITAEKLDVSCLSAISANIGCVTSGTIVGTVIKTSNECCRIELYGSGLYSYDTSGNLTVKIKDGQMCLVDATCDECYSYLDHGQLKFNHPYGSVPYVKRICAGTACAGSTVTLCQWYEQPQVQMGVRHLMSYQSDYCASCQEWCVYADNFAYYDNGSGDFGWTFDVHAKLVTSGGTRDECIYLVDFDVTKVTGVNTCQVLVKEMWQLWCNAAAPANYYYGHSCFDIRYRVCGCGVWCNCSLEYCQPHSTISELKCTQVVCHTVNFGCSDEWEIQLHENAFQWVDSGLEAGTTVCCNCCYDSSGNDSSSLGLCSPVTGSPHTCEACDNMCVNVPFDSSGKTILCWCQGMCYDSCFCHQTEQWCADEATASWQLNATSALCARFCNYETVHNDYCHYEGCVQNTCCGNPWYCSDVCNFVSGFYYSDYCDDICFCTYLRLKSSGPHGNPYYPWRGCGWIVASVCCVWQRIWWEEQQGAAGCCKYEKFYSSTETTGSETVLDSGGDVNYLAIAYS